MRKLFNVLTLVLFVSGLTFASFPVQMSKQSERESKSTSITNERSTDVTSAVKATNNESNQLQSGKGGGKGGSSSHKDLTTLILLWVFLGFVAGHRWYAGKPVGWNILFILTAGGCGVWAIIDLINILTGKF